MKTRSHRLKAHPGAASTGNAGIGTAISLASIFFLLPGANRHVFVKVIDLRVPVCTKPFPTQLVPATG
jgi:hypothetical protein